MLWVLMIQRNEASIYLLGWGVPTFDAFYSLQSLVGLGRLAAPGNPAKFPPHCRGATTTDRCSATHQRQLAGPFKRS